MKALILTTEDGEYDSFHVTIDAVHMVPDNFDAEADQKALAKHLLDARDPRLGYKKDGKPRSDNHRKVYRIWLASLTERFGVTPFEEHSS